MTDISKDLAALRIPQEERGGHRLPVATVAAVIVVIALVGTGGWDWSTQMQAETGQVGLVAPKAGGPAAPGGRVHASGHVVGRRRAPGPANGHGRALGI